MLDFVALDAMKIEKVYTACSTIIATLVQKLSAVTRPLHSAEPASVKNGEITPLEG